MSADTAASSHSLSDSPVRQRRRQSRRRVLSALVLLLLVAGGWLWLGGEEEAAADQPLIVTVEIGDIENTIAATGSLKPLDFVDVGAQVSGQLQILHVEVGDLVEQGQLLAEIDARVQANRVEASRASIAAQEAQLAARKAALILAEANAERQERLMADNATSQLDYDTAMNTLASAKASLEQLDRQIAQSKAELASEETELGFSSIYAPMTGTVVSIEMNEGRTLNANQSAPTILRIADLSMMTVETRISEADIGRIRRGMEVYFTTLGSGQRRWSSALRQILPTPLVENNVVLYTGLFDVENQDGILLPEMTAQVFFVTSAAYDVLTVPVGALTFLDEGPASAAQGVGALAARAAGQGGATGARMPGARPNMPPSGGSIAAGYPVAGQSGPAAFPSARQGGAEPRRLAMVQVVNEDGSVTEREVVIGVMSRVAAEVISGLRAGDRVIAGILQPDLTLPEDDFRGGNFRMRPF